MAMSEKPDPAEVGKKGMELYSEAKDRNLLGKFSKVVKVGKSVGEKAPSIFKRESDMDLEDITRRYDCSETDARFVRAIHAAFGIKPGSAAFDMCVWAGKKVAPKILKRE